MNKYKYDKPFINHAVQMKHFEDLVQRKTERTVAAEFRFAFALLSPGARFPHKDAARRSSTTVRRVAGEMNDLMKTVS